ncbi:MAG: ribbon-helix-helix protein, CopG family [Deltaproteobacteria bacterium]|nr:ribbon-helix-helix protein, CopG family [Deltaproteobacteria bacterium]
MKLTRLPTDRMTEDMTKTISIRIDEELLHAVDVAGEDDNRGRSEVIREALEAWLKQRALGEKVRRHREGYARHPVAPDEFASILKAQVWPK